MGWWVGYAGSENVDRAYEAEFFLEWDIER